MRDGLFIKVPAKTVGLQVRLDELKTLNLHHISRICRKGHGFALGTQNGIVKFQYIPDRWPFPRAKSPKSPAQRDKIVNPYGFC